MKRQTVALFYSRWPAEALARPPRNRLLEQYRYAVWYKANPRSAEYMRALLQERFPDAEWVDVADGSGWTSRLAHADKVVLIYPDSIGLGFSSIERAVMTHKLDCAGVVALNGRRREFRLNAATRLGLRLRRVLEWTMLPELLFMTVFIMITPVLLAIDAVPGALVTDSPDVQNWWRDNPMTYAPEHGRTAYKDGQYEMGTPEFFERLDREFYSWNKPLHGSRPFDRLFPYDDYNNSSSNKVLEIGCGLGTLAMNWARNGADITAVDLNPTSIEQTKKRFDLLGLKGRIETMDGRQLALPDEAFDYAYSWGVLHHSPDLEQSLREMMRVLKPGGGFGLMLYNRRSILHWYKTVYTEGFLHYENRFLGPLKLTSRYGDGARAEGNPHTWPETKQSLHEMLGRYSKDMHVRILGTDLDTVFHALLPGLGLLLPAWAKKPRARRFGWSLWAYGHKDL